MVESEWEEAMHAAGFAVRNKLIWVKPAWFAGDLATTFGQQYETILFGARGHHVLRENRCGDVWIEKGSCFRTGKVHPTEKPLNLMMFLCNKSTDESNIIVDPFCGSGTTLVAAQKLRRHYLGFELCQNYVDIAQHKLLLVESQPSIFQKEKIDQPQINFSV
jgi:site-specific DNA-methyltransferase (adenine-specific)